MNEVKMYAISKELGEKILKYLSPKPYNEVGSMINELLVLKEIKSKKPIKRGAGK